LLLAARRFQIKVGWMLGSAMWTGGAA